MVLDIHGNPIAENQTHQFGHFVIPEDCTITGFGSMQAKDKFNDCGTYGIGNREQAIPRANKE